MGKFLKVAGDQILNLKEYTKPSFEHYITDSQLYRMAQRLFKSLKTIQLEPVIKLNMSRYA